MFFAKIPRHTRQNAITEGDMECILTRNGEGTEQLRSVYMKYIITVYRKVKIIPAVLIALMQLHTIYYVRWINI